VMFRRKSEARVSRAPGTWDRARLLQVDIDLSELSAQAGPAPPPDSGWLESSRDLQRGMRARETPMDSLPADLIDALLQRRP
jgi:hypothetical protein